MFRFSTVHLCLLLTASASAAETKIDSKSRELFARLSAQLTAARTAEVDLRLAVKTTNAPANDLAANYALTIERPNKMALVLKQGDLGATVVSDGTNVVTYIPKPNIYSVQPASKQIGIVSGSGPTADLGSMAFITALFSENPQSALLAGVNEATHAGQVIVTDTECERIDLKQEGLSWRLFATRGEKPVVRRIEVTIPQLELAMDFTGWKLNPPVAPERFQFKPPAEAKKADKGFDQAEAEDGEESELIGEKLPELKLKSVDGDTFDTKAFNGRVAILVIWAGEAQHSLSALRAASELATAHKGVVAQSINIDEKADKAAIKKLLAKHNLSVKTALDQNREAIDKLEIDGVPLTLLINKSGVVEKAFLGYHRDFKALVGKELAQLQAAAK